MKQTIFETRQRADELMREAINIWRQSAQSDFLEGLEDDPVMSLIMTALAYQMNETVSEYEHMKAEVLEEYAQLLTPYEIGHATPATAVVEGVLQDDIPELEISSQSTFTLAGSDFVFLPLLKTRLLNAKVKSVTRIDGRRWKISLNFVSPISDLSGFAFAIKNEFFQDIKVTLKGQRVPIARPWDYSELPLMDCFGIDTILYNRSQTYEASTACLDLFARQNVRIFVVKKHDAKKFIESETDTLDLIFEFQGLSDKFVFDKSNFSLNPILLVNAQINHITLSAATPVVRVAGYDATEGQTDTQFMHAVRPSEEQIYGNSMIEIRRVAADRFNQGTLVRLLNALIARYHSDYYAFQNLQGISGDKTMQALQEILSRLMEAAQKDKLRQVSGVYIFLREPNSIRTGSGSVEIQYLTTAGANINSSLSTSSSFVVPSGMNATATQMIANPVMGCDEIKDKKAMASLSRYYIATCDRIVTSADIKLFCYNELLSRSGIVRNMVKNISIGRRQNEDLRQCGYEIIVNIELEGNMFVKRSFADKIPQVEILLQKMIEVRSTNIYPIIVNIQIATSK
jgi:hypothetical protein